MTSDPINHPQHYQHPSGVECIQITEHMSFLMGNAIKYIWRADHKGSPINDLRKAIWYLEREITRRTDEANTAPLVTKSVSLPDADARRQYEMGNACAYGDGMPKDLDHAREWWRLAAAQGHAEAQSALDVYAILGSTQRPTEEPDEHIKDVRMLAARGDQDAQIQLADAYQHGRHGLIRNEYRAQIWRSRANEPRTEEAEQ